MNLVTPLAAAPAAALDEMLAHRNYLVRFAQRRLHDPMLAEDVVHDVFEAVLDGRATFGGRAALRSWLTAVLKHKIVDLVRRRPLHASLDDDADALDEACPQPRPDEAAEQRERLHRALARIEAMPVSLRSGLDGKFSIQYTTLIALLDGEVSVDSFTNERLRATGSPRERRDARLPPPVRREAGTCRCPQR